MQLFFKTANGEAMAIQVESSDTIAEVKNKIRTAAGYAADTEVRMVYAGKVLQEQRICADGSTQHLTLSDYNIQKESDYHEDWVTFPNIATNRPGCSMM